MIFQQFNLVAAMTALQNVELPLILAGKAPPLRRERAEACLEQVGLAGRLHHRPGELSGGEQQRVAIARALVHDPPLLLADEPTGNLDSTTGQHILELLARLQRDEGRSVIVVTHHLGEVEQFAGEVVELHDGEIIENR